MEQRLLKIMKKRLNYNDNDFELFKTRKENLEVLSKYKELGDIEIIAEVKSARGCNSQHKVGQSFFFDGTGNLIASKSPEKSCIFLLGSLPGFFFAIHELIYAGVKPEDIELRFPHVGCYDVGVENCGWGKVIVEVTVQRKAEDK